VDHDTERSAARRGDDVEATVVVGGSATPGSSSLRSASPRTRPPRPSSSPTRSVTRRDGP